MRLSFIWYSKPILKDTLNKDAIHLISLLRTNSVASTEPWQYTFTSERGQPLYINKIRKLAWSLSACYLLLDFIVHTHVWQCDKGLV